MRASVVRGMAVVDLNSAEQLGQVDKVIIDPDARRVGLWLRPKVRPASAAKIPRASRWAPCGLSAPSAVTV
jgi:uncharacterized protein YrrD